MNTANQFTDYCPLCHHAAGILNVGREHYAVCHDCRAYCHVGSNLFSAWRSEKPADWDANKKLLAIYKNVSADYARLNEYTHHLDSLPLNEVANAPTLNEYFGGKSKSNAPTKPKTSRPPLGSLGDCLAQTAQHEPLGYAKITAVEHDELRLHLEPETACMFDAPVTVFIRAGVTPEHAREILKEAARCLKGYDTLEPWTPQDFLKSTPFDDGETIPF